MHALGKFYQAKRRKCSYYYNDLFATHQKVRCHGMIFSFLLLDESMDVLLIQILRLFLCPWCPWNWKFIDFEGVDELFYVFKKFQSSEVYVHLRLRSRLLMGDYSSHRKQHWHKVKIVDNSHLSRSSVEFPLLLSLVIIKHKQSVIDLATFLRTIFYWNLLTFKYWRYGCPKVDHSPWQVP